MWGEENKERGLGNTVQGKKALVLEGQLSEVYREGFRDKKKKVRQSFASKGKAVWYLGGSGEGKKSSWDRGQN